MTANAKRCRSQRRRLIGEARCIECRGFAAFANRCRRCSARNRERTKSVYARRKAAGECVSCGAAPAAGRIRCAPCLDKIADANAVKVACANDCKPVPAARRKAGSIYCSLACVRAVEAWRKREMRKVQSK